MSLVHLLRCFMLRQPDSTEDIDSPDDLRLRRGVQTARSEEDVRAARTQSPTKGDTIDLAACMHDETQRRNKLFEEVLHTQPAVRSSVARREEGAHISYKMARAASTRVYACGGCGAPRPQPLRRILPGHSRRDCPGRPIRTSSQPRLGPSPHTAPPLPFLLRRGMGRPPSECGPKGASRAQHLPGRLGADGLPGGVQRARPGPDPRDVCRGGLALPLAPAVLCAMQGRARHTRRRCRESANGRGTGRLGPAQPAPLLCPGLPRPSPVRVVCAAADGPDWHRGQAGSVLPGRTVPAAARRTHRHSRAGGDAAAVLRVRPDAQLHRPAAVRQAPVGLQRQPARERVLRQLPLRGKHQAPRRAV
jgi:hypothetical protein